MIAKHIFATHDYNEEFHKMILNAGKTGWTVYAIDIGHDVNDKSGRDFRKKDLTAIVRLSNAFGDAGGLPHPRDYDNFAQRAANFVKASQGVEYVIHHNEYNILDWDYNKESGPITMEQAVDSYLKFYKKIKAVAPHVKIAPGPLATWNTGWGTWIEAWVELLKRIGYDKIDYLPIHAYATSPDLENFTDFKPMNSPFQHRSYSFRVFNEYMDAIPKELRHLEVMITECNFNGRWKDNHTGRWIQHLYWFINEWNKNPENQKVLCAAIFRVEQHDDKWSIRDQRSKDDFKQALQWDYQHNYQAKPPINIKPNVGPGTWAVVTAQAGLNLRNAPVNGKILTVLIENQSVKIHEEKDGWSMVSIPNTNYEGWVASEYLKKT